MYYNHEHAIFIGLSISGILTSMEASYDQLALERSCKAEFGITLAVKQIIAWRIPVSRTDDATVFLTDKKQLFVYIQAASSLALSDVKKIISRMGLKAELYLPPKGRPQYFDEIGRSKFLEVFPGRASVSPGDIVFYRTLAPYNPALVQIHEVSSGAIYQYDSDASSSWRPSVKFAYRRIRTS